MKKNTTVSSFASNTLSLLIHSSGTNSQQIFTHRFGSNGFLCRFDRFLSGRSDLLPYFVSIRRRQQYGGTHTPAVSWLTF